MKVVMNLVFQIKASALQLAGAVEYADYISAKV